jgi:hypothetical protein
MIPMPGGEISILTTLHPTGLWITVPITVAQRVTLFMVLDPGSPASAISPVAVQTLRNWQLIRAVDEDTRAVQSHLLTDLDVQGQPLPDVRVQVLARLARLARWRIRDVPLEIDGLLGLDFLGQFVDIHFNVPTMRLRLVYP